MSTNVERKYDRQDKQERLRELFRSAEFKDINKLDDGGRRQGFFKGYDFLVDLWWEGYFIDSALEGEYISYERFI